MPNHTSQVGDSTSSFPAGDGPKLARHIGLFALIAYGVGDMVGAGIYGTIGKAAALMGNAVWLAFAGSMLAALFTGLSYASLSSRYPRAAGAAFITQRAFGFSFLSYVIGLVVIASGLTSMATSSNVFAVNLAAFFDQVGFLADVLNPWVLVLMFMALMTFINYRGIRESMWANILCMAVEVGGLLFVIAVGMRYWGGVNYMETPPQATGTQSLDVWLIASGAVLTFFSFIGFEDMLNVGEEVKNPRRTMPWGIVIALLVTTVLYMAISITAVSVVDYRELGDETMGPPLVQITNKAAPWLPGWVFGVITLFAVANTALINYIMGSRLIYGMSRQGLLPAPLGRVHARRRTPHVAIFALVIIAALLAFAGNIVQLASATSLLLLLAFCVVNIALVVLKYRKGEAKGAFEVPVFIPILGVLTCAGLIASRLSRLFAGHEGSGGWIAPVIAGGLVLFISLLYFIARPKAVSEEALIRAAHEH